ncbi:hypothetical protein GCM10012275_15680 [Longimycelium tulufanense]|uniref:Lipoprotein n=1 Tax=Longimycelium tulufanense TaxID=907463 RepID=A0A8J3FTY8_9PSEU|nr:hypothetical protein [Longimycelium tulufanense]GGM45484.1 hypothetical protein GCM10012275_15680 [Longimycelium tulufanense]
MGRQTRWIAAVGAIGTAAVLVWWTTTANGAQPEAATPAAQVQQQGVVSEPETTTPEAPEAPDVSEGYAPPPGSVPSEQPPAGNQTPAKPNPPADSGAGAPKGVTTSALKKVKLSAMGEAVADSEGFLLYRFDKDTAKPPKSNCAGECAKKWPPVLAQGKPTLEGVDPSLVGTVKRSDGTEQVTLAGWPLYRFAGDPKPGAWKGQGLQGVWFVVAPDGKRNVSCLPKGVTPPQS